MLYEFTFLCSMDGCSSNLDGHLFTSWTAKLSSFMIKSCKDEIIITIIFSFWVKDMVLFSFHTKMFSSVSFSFLN